MFCKIRTYNVDNRQTTHAPTLHKNIGNKLNAGEGFLLKDFHVPKTLTGRESWKEPENH